MSAYSFLAALPAILAIGGFVIYHVLGVHKDSNRITEQIVSKLRREAPEQAGRLQGLGPKQIADKLKMDHELRTTVGEQDFQLLRTVTRNEFVKSIVVYVLVALFFALSVLAYVYLKTRPEPVTMQSWQLESDHPDAKGLAVDLDPLALTWQATGPGKPVDICLENVQSRRRSEVLHTSTDQQRVVFQREDYLPILGKRSHGEVNRVRAAARVDDRSFTSPEFSLYIGVTVMALPDKERNQVMIFAVIDNARIDGYSFDAQLLAWRNSASLGPETFGGQINDSRGDFPVPDFDAVRWETASLTYFGPDDQRLVRKITK